MFIALSSPPVVVLVFPVFPEFVLPVLLDVFPGFVPGVVDDEPDVLPVLDVESVPGVVICAGELSSSTFILSSLPVASFVTAYIPKFCFAYSYNILYFFRVCISC